MTRDEAQRCCDQLNREHPDRGTHRWIPQQAGDVWQVARVRLPHGVAISPLRATVEARPRPPLAPDPRSGPFRDAPPFGGAA